MTAPVGEVTMPTVRGKAGRGRLRVGVEEAFGFEALLELFEGELERACADRLHGFGDQLHLSALLVDADAAANQDMKAVFRAKAQEHGLAAEEDDGELGVGVLEGEVDVAGGGGAIVGDFAFDPDVAVLLLDEFADLGDEFADRPDAAGFAGLVEDEAELGGEAEMRREWVLKSHCYEV